MIRVEFNIKNINYEETAEKVLPILLEKMKEKGDKGGKFAKVILGLKGLPNMILKGALSVIPQHTKDDMAVYFLNAYKEDILDYLNKTARENQIAIEVADMSFENPDQKNPMSQGEE